jgi:hypothetical protein
MCRLIRIVAIIAWVFCSIPAIPAQAQESPLPFYCTEGMQESGAYYFICVPPVGWNGNLIVFAHGYVSPTLPVGGYPFDQLALPDNTSLIEIVNGLGYAFAASGYSKNGLAVQEGLADSVDLVDIFARLYGEPEYIYLAGASEGGLIATLGIERFSEVFDGGLATCGPIGNFRKQINYWGDFRVIFDYFYPGVLPPSPVAVPAELMENWESIYAPQVAAAIQANPSAASQLLRVTGAPVDSADPTSVLETALGVLWYNVFATNDGVETLGGQPFDNSYRWYSGSANDLLLNRRVQRFSANPEALNAIQAYQTTGVLHSQLVTLHTTGDPIVPYWHIPLYRAKVLKNWTDWNYSNIPILRYGHCNFEVSEVLAGFALLVWKTTGELPPTALSLLPDAKAQAYYQSLLETYTSTGR